MSLKYNNFWMPLFPGNTATLIQEDADVYDCDIEKEKIDIYQKVDLNTLSSEILTCDKCDAKFPDEPEL